MNARSKSRENTALTNTALFPFTEGFSFVEAGDMDVFKQAVTDKTCAVMLEMIQGEGGVNILDKDYVKALVSYCKKNDLVVIVDEVQTGIGRTGKLFAFQNYGVQPDLVTMAKGLGGGLPIGVCMCGEKLSGVMTPSTHGSTFGANPVVCAGANYVLDTVADEDFLAAVREKGDYLEKKLRELPDVKNVRRMGLMVGIEIDGDTAKDVLRMLPPLIITKEEIDEAVCILKSTLEECHK